MTKPTRLCDILVNPSPSTQILCSDPNKTWGDLLLQVMGTANHLPHQQNQRWLLSLSDPFQFTAGLLACWQQELVPIILPDSLPGTFAQAASFGAGALCDADSPPIALPTLQPTPASHGNGQGRKRQPQDVALELFTSGSTGIRKRIPKTFAQLDAEIEVLHQLWGEDAGIRLATVSHRHIYGLLFRILWPLSTGGIFSNRTHLFWETLTPQLSPDHFRTIISSPAHLKHLAESAAETDGNWSHTRIFSSGGPLPRSIACDIAKYCGQAPIEVLGSTETGGIAWRQQDPTKDQPWTPLPKVHIQIQDQVLAVKSPFLNTIDDFQATGDRAEALPAGRFQLKGRLDRIAKLAEKRVSLTEMERKLAEHPGVTLAKCVVLPHKSDRQRDTLGCVVQPSLAGKALLFRQGRSAFTQALRQHLQPYFEAVTLPRHWRFPTLMPVDRQSKISVSTLWELFASKIHERPRFPKMLERVPIEDGVRLHLEIPENLLQLEGHFKQVAVVAGIVQLHWVMEIIAMETGEPVAVTELEVIKFHRLLLPKDRFEVEIKRHPKSGKWNYRFITNQRKFASGRIVPAPRRD